MMYFLLILFFGSLASIIFMVGRKIFVLKNGRGFYHMESVVNNVEHLEEIKNLAAKNIKTYGYKGLVVAIRFYVKSSNFLMEKYKELKTKVKEGRKRKSNTKEKKEVSGFLKMISEYKQKIRRIKRQIKEEENL